MSTLTADVSTELIPTEQMTALPNGYAPRPRLVGLFGKSEMFWIRLERARKGPPVTRLGRTPLYKLSDVLDWLESQKPRKARFRRHATPAKAEAR